MSKIVVPPVSLQKKTTGFGMAIIDLICLSGILLQEQSTKGNKRWFLALDYKQPCFIYLWMDCLSIAFDT